MIRWSLSRYLRCDDRHPSPSSHRKWMSDGMEGTRSLQNKILLIWAIQEVAPIPGANDDEISDDLHAGGIGSWPLDEPTTPQSQDATRA